MPDPVYRTSLGHLPQVPPLSGIGFSFTCCRERITVTMACREDVLSREEMDRLMATMSLAWEGDAGTDQADQDGN